MSTYGKSKKSCVGRLNIQFQRVVAPGNRREKKSGMPQRYL